MSSEPGAHAAMERALRARVRRVQRARVRDMRAACVISWRAGGLAKPLARVAVYPLTPPLSLDIAGRDGETVSEVQKQRRWESFGEHICNLPCTGNVRDAHLADGDLLTNKVNVELDMLCSPVMYWIPRHVDRGDVVAERHCRGWNLAMELAKEVSEPGALGDGVGNGAVLRLSARPRDRGLSLEHHETRE